MKGSAAPFFFLLSLVSRTVLPFILFPFCFSFLSLSFFLFIFLYLFFPYPSSTEFFWLDLRKFPPSFSSLPHGHVSSHGPSIMCHVSPCEPCAMCHIDTCFRWHLPHHMALMPCVLLPWCHVAAPGHAMWHHPMCHPTPGALKNLKFWPSRNSTKFDWVTGFRETNSTVKFILSSEI